MARLVQRRPDTFPIISNRFRSIKRIRLRYDNLSVKVPDIFDCELFCLSKLITKKPGVRQHDKN